MSTLHCSKGGIMDLILAVKGKWFDQILSGDKTEEYRLDNPYWRKRLIDKAFDKVIITWGYPKKDDRERRVFFPYNGYVMKTITSEEWDNIPQRVFAIYLDHSAITFSEYSSP